MDYLSAVLQATERIRAAGVADAVEAQACLRLACLGFDDPDPSDRASVLVGLEIGTLLAELYPDPAPIVITAAGPGARRGPQLREALTRLLTALADSYDRASAGAETPVQDRFAYAGAACRLRAAVGDLP